MKPLKTLLLVCLLYVFNTKGQTIFTNSNVATPTPTFMPFSCGNVKVLPYNPNSPSSVNNFVNTYNNQKTAYLNSLSPQSGNWVIPVVVHVLYNNPSENISYNQIQWAIASLNAGFQNAYPSYNNTVSGPLATNTQIQFCLAQLPMGDNWTNNNEPGVMRYPVPTAFLDQQLDVPASVSQLLTTTHSTPAHFPYQNYLNIWLVNQINDPNSSTPNTVVGYSNFPNTPGALIDGIVIRRDAFGDNSILGNTFPLNSAFDKGTVLVHEVGHYLNLFHTFHQINSTNTSVLQCLGDNASNCSTDGDLICDTPPTINITACGPTNSCTNDILPAYGNADHNDITEDFMSYGGNPCWNTFTNEQSQRMHITLSNAWPVGRQDMTSTSNLIATGLSNAFGCCPSSVLSAAFTHVENCNTVSFTNLVPTCNNNANYSWNFGDSNSGSGLNPVHTYNAEGIYNVVCTVTDINGNSYSYNTQVSTQFSSYILSQSAPTHTVCNGSKQSITIFFGKGVNSVQLTDGTNIVTVNNLLAPATETNIVIYTFNATANVTYNLLPGVCNNFPLGSATFSVMDCCPNMVFNGDFELGTNTGFTTDLSSTGDPNGDFIIIDPAISTLVSYMFMPGVANTGLGMLCNGFNTNGGGTINVCTTGVNTGQEGKIWEQTITGIQANTNYYISCELNRNRTGPSTYYQNGNLKYRMRIEDGFGNLFNSPVLEQPIITNWSGFAHTPFNFVFTTPATVSTTYTFTIYQIENFNVSYFDFFLDNVNLQAMAPSISVATTASPNNPISGNAVTVNAIVTPPGTYSYAWSPNIGNTASVTFVPTDNATYTCNVTDQCGNVVSSSLCINLESSLCSTASNITLNNTNITSNTFYSGQVITVIGTINITNCTLAFNSCTLKMSTNSKIIVDPTSIISMANSKMFSCEGMWFGIEAQSNTTSAAKVSIRGTSIEDAYNAIIANNNFANVNNSISLTSVTLNKNYIDVSLSNASAATSYPLLIQSCDLTSNLSTTSPGNSLKCSGYYPVGTPAVKARSYAGLFADRAGVVILTNNNIGANFTKVSNKDYGLFLRRTDATVYNIQFRDITSTTSLLAPMTGPLPLPVGVSIFSSNARILIANPVTTPVNNALLFRNVGYGIITNKTLIVEVVNAEFANPSQFAAPNLPANISTGIGVSAVYTIDADATLRINSNTISKVFNAITATYSVAPKAAGLFSISQNMITAGSGTLNTAIDILSTLNTPFTGVVGNQIVAANQINNASIAGVRMLNVTGTNGLRVSGNTIFLRNSPTGTRDGILLNGGNNNVMIDNNSVDGNLPGNNPTSYNLNCSGIRSVNSPGCFIQCNNITHTGKGIVYSGNNATGAGGTGTEFFGNNLNAPIKQGLVINNGGMIGTQGNSTGASANVWNGFSTANSDQTLVGGPFPFSPLTDAVNSILFVRNLTGIAAERPTDNSFSLPSGVSQSFLFNTNLLPTNIGAFDIITCPPILTTGAKVILTPTLDVTQRNADYSTYITSVITPTSIAAPQAKWMLKQHMHKAIRQTQIGNDATVANFYVAEQTGDAAKYYEVDSLLEQGDTILAKAKNNVAPVNNDIEQTHHDFNQLYLSGITNGTDYAVLETIANLCAYKYGNAVYQARALVNIVTYGNRDFEENCENGEGSRIGNFSEEDNGISVAENIQAHLFPNPNNGNFTLSYDLKQIPEASIQIIDITGKVVYTNAIDNLNNLVQINAQDLHSGMYFIQLMNKNTLLWTDKVMISK